jgi:hypothetical protein
MFIQARTVATLATLQPLHGFHLPPTTKCDVFHFVDC